MDDTADVIPLHYATQYNTLEIAKLLIVAGISFLTETDDGQTPLQITKLNGHIEIIKLITNIYLLARMED